MSLSSAKYSCKYYSVGYFIFIESDNADLTRQFSMEPIIEVADEAQGIEFIDWLQSNHFIAQQIANIANDNY